MYPLQMSFFVVPLSIVEEITRLRSNRPNFVHKYTHWPKMKSGLDHTMGVERYIEWENGGQNASFLNLGSTEAED